MKYETLLFGIIGLLALINLAGIGVWVAHHARRLQGQPGLLAPQWSLLTVWFVPQVVFVILVLAALPLLSLLTSGPANGIETRGRAFEMPSSSTAWIALAMATLIQQGAFVGISWALLKKFGSSWAQIGLRGLPNRADWLQGLACGVVLLLMSALAEAALNVLMGGGYAESLGRKDQSSRVIQEAVRSLSGSLWLWAGLGLFVVVLAPLTEEIFFRGVLYNALKHRLGHGWAAPINGVIFAAIHLSWIGFLPRMLMGWLLANFYQRSGSLWVPIIAHGVNNAAALMVLARLVQA